MYKIGDKVRCKKSYTLNDDIRFYDYYIYGNEYEILDIEYRDDMLHGNFVKISTSNALNESYWVWDGIIENYSFLTFNDYFDSVKFLRKLKLERLSNV